ncbi:MAG: anti-sigma F factor [Eubacteriales bacterium]|nr:anti-sigma F factor [Eubacteriales bacterium]
MRKKAINSFKCIFPAKSVNESFSRYIIAAFVTQLELKVNDLADIKTAVSEAVTNVIVHGYNKPEYAKSQKLVFLSCDYYSDGKVVITVRDKGCGIENVAKAMEPLYTTAPEEERSGMGFTIMQALTDDVRVISKPGKGTTVRLIRKMII